MILQIFLNIKLMKRALLVFAIMLVSLQTIAGDTIRVMQYNLLYYDRNTGWCNATNNNVDSKDGYLRDITGYYKPDIFTVNEMNGSVTSVQRLLDNVFVSNGQSYFKRANFAGSYLVNMFITTHKFPQNHSNILQHHPESPTSIAYTTVGRFVKRRHDLFNMHSYPFESRKYQ